MSKYNIGDIVWITEVGTKPVTKLCPVCFGKKKVVLILGDDSHVELDCKYCARGYESPSGYTVEYEFIAKAEKAIISEIRSEQNQGGIKIEYILTNNRYEKEDGIFSTEEEAVEQCKIRCTKLELKQSTKAEYLKQDVKKKDSWNAGYHLREAKRCEEQAIYHRGKAALCKAKA